MSATRFALVTALASAFVLSFGTPAQADGITAFFLIDRVESELADEGFFIVPKGPGEDPDGCGGTSKYASFSDRDSPGNHERMSVALMALTAGREVRLTLSGCLGSVPKIVSITVR